MTIHFPHLASLTIAEMISPLRRAFSLAFETLGDIAASMSGRAHGGPNGHPPKEPT